MAISAILHSIKSITYRHQNIRFRVFRQSLRVYKLWVYLGYHTFLTISNNFWALKTCHLLEIPQVFELRRSLCYIETDTPIGPSQRTIYTFRKIFFYTVKTNSRAPVKSNLMMPCSASLLSFLNLIRDVTVQVGGSRRSF